MHQISISSSNGLQAMTIEEPALAAPIESVSQKERVQSLSPTGEYSFRNTAKESNLVWYRGFFGTVKIQFRSNSPTPSNTRRHEIKATNKEKIITITPILLRKTLELRLQNSFGRISRTLSTYPVLEDRAPIFEICREGDLQGLQVALSSGSVSPFVLDEDGWSLLHVSASIDRYVV